LRAAVHEVIDALKQRGFEFVGRGDNGLFRLHGTLKAGGLPLRCELTLDPGMFELPGVRLLQLPDGLPAVTPHLLSDGRLCYVAKGTVVLDIFDPVGQSLACLKRAEDVLTKVLAGELVEDLEEDFYAYWGGHPCLVDMQHNQLGRQETLVVKQGGSLVPVVTDDEVRTRQKLASLGLEVTDCTMLTHRVQSRAKPRPHLRVWPPATIKDVLAWQAALDPRCRKKIEKRVEEGWKSAARGQLFLIESPLMTYGFVVHFDRPPDKPGFRRQPKVLMYGLKVTPVSVLRIDDRYLAERNVPGKRTLAGKRVVVVGCGTIGGYLAELLVKAGAGTSDGQLTLVDFDNLMAQNIGRHRLGFPHMFRNKAAALAEELGRLAPGANIRALPVDVKMAALGDVDLLIDATGEEALGHWLCGRYLATTPMLSVWIEGPGTAVRGLLRTQPTGACYRCLFEANRRGLFTTVKGTLPTQMVGQGCEGLYVPFPASASLQAASLGADMALGWVNGNVSPALRTRLLDSSFELATPDCDPPRMAGCPACSA
jgi:molybdopterin/thiamine biosynthesis adenylyltransferase